MNEKGSSIFLILISIIILLIVCVLGWNFVSKTIKTSQPVSNIATEQKNVSELEDFPIYPGAVFVTKNTIPPCEEETSGYTICNALTYEWEIDEKLNKVLEWYENNSSGWKKTGGAGSVDEDIGGGVESFQKGELKYDLHYSGSSPSQTTITLAIPLGPREIIPSSLCKEKNSIYGFIELFEALQRERNSVEILKLFTPPVTSEEIKNYNFLAGKETGFPGLYGNVTTNIKLVDYKIVGGPIESKNGCTVLVEEQRSIYSNAKPIGYQSATIYKASFDLVKENDSWKINEYYPTGEIPRKYSAWGY